MRLLDKPMSQSEKENLRRMLDGCLCRICVSDNNEEILCQAGFAVDYIMLLAYSRTKELSMRESS